MSSAHIFEAERKPWDKGIAPAFIALFLNIVFLDQLAMRTLAVGGLAPSLLGALGAGVVAFAVLFAPLAKWGFDTRQGFSQLAESTFGVVGARVLTVVGLGLAQVAWFAVALHYAADLGVQGLTLCGLLDPAWLNPPRPGVLRVNPLFLSLVIVWSLAAALIGTLAVRLVAAVMSVYILFPACAIAALVVWAMPGLGEFRPLGFDPVTANIVANPPAFSSAVMFQLVLSFIAGNGLFAAAWGASCPTRRDWVMGGLVGLIGGSLVLTTLSLLVVAGGQGRAPAGSPLARAGTIQRRYAEGLVTRPGGLFVMDSARNEIRDLRARNYQLKTVIAQGLGPRAAGITLLILALGLLGPCCYTPFVIGRSMADAVPRVPAWAWSLAAAPMTWPLVALGATKDTEVLFGWIGAVCAPMLAILAVDVIRNRGRWPGASGKVRFSMIIAWFAGVAVGLAPLLNRAWPMNQRLDYASTFWAMATSFAAGLVLWREPAPSRST